MKKIAFFTQWMLCGGVENALISLGNKLIMMGHEVTIYSIVKKGEFVEKVPDEINFFEIPMKEDLRNSIPVGGTKITVRDCMKKREYLKALEFSIKHKLNKTPFAELNVNLEEIPQLNRKYDIAVNFHMHSPFLVWYLSQRVEARKKYTWIHNDFRTTKYEISALKEYLKCVDQFFAVSQQLKREFIEAIPEYATKTQVALNIVPTDQIIKKGNETYPDEYKKVDCIKILTVGRLEEQKGYDLAIQVCKKLKDDGFKFKWYVLGEGTLKKCISNDVKKYGLTDCFFLLGNRMNPYPYFKYCDIYVQCSRHEGYVTTVTEAKLFNKPIITTDVSGAREQIIDKKNGRVVAIKVESVFEALKEVVNDGKKRSIYTNNLKTKPFKQDLNYIKKYFNS
ncbi:glycosyltransferase [uncultured Dubosiella sp.]|uniref:glycosyltransferase n=1 Tax=uncultured Dubosiella sp. TaxID=1937011 RepID=UPI002598B915|nr:glycosyltransferase [uncultured Dubosiella sp.]